MSLVIIVACCVILVFTVLLFKRQIVAKIISWKLIGEEKIHFHHDLGSKIVIELEGDETISPEEWEEWLKISIFADKRFNEKSRKQVESDGLEQIVREIIEEEKEI